jgi:hypothetical protein
MALVKDTNSYCTVAEAELYFADRIDSAAWTDSDDETKAQALITATAFLDEKPWTGAVVDEAQPLAFPRVGSYFDPRIGYSVDFDGVPKRIITATFEMAYHMIANDDLQSSAGSVTDIVVGPITLKQIQETAQTPSVVLRQIKPMLANGGSNIWWRAN